jgi:hypothetical protein
MIHSYDRDVLSWRVVSSQFRSCAQPAELAQKPKTAYESATRITFMGVIIDQRSRETQSPRCAARPTFGGRKERGP